MAGSPHAFHHSDTFLFDLDSSSCKNKHPHNSDSLLRISDDDGPSSQLDQDKDTLRCPDLQGCEAYIDDVITHSDT